jgi:DNA invertase Pin-like site-specific DNA recombinase
MTALVERLAPAVAGIAESLGRRAVRAVIYCRISENDSGDMLGVKRQEQICRRICDDLGWVVVAVFRDNNTSARSGERREHHEDMLDYIRAGLADAVVVWKVDRLVRDHEKRNDARDFCRFAEEHALKFESDGGTLNLTTAAGRKRFQDEALEAEFESGYKAERLQEKFEELAHAGKWHGGPPRFGWEYEPFTRPDGTTGYRFTGRLNEDQAELLRQAAKLALAGVPLRAIVRQWNTEGIPSLASDKWDAGSVKRLLRWSPVNAEEAARKEEATRLIDPDLPLKDQLRVIARQWNARGIRREPPATWSTAGLRQLFVSPETAGHRSYHGVVTKRNAYPATLDETTHQLLADKLNDPARPRPSGSAGRAHMLTGDRGEELGFCLRCGERSRINGTRDGRGKRVYKCLNCGLSRSAEKVEEFIRDLLFFVHDSEDFRRSLAGLTSDDSTRSGLANTLQDLAARKQRLRDDLARGRIESDDFMHAKRVIEAEERQYRGALDRLERPLRALEAFPQHGQELREAWAANGAEWRHAFAKAYIRRVGFLPVGPGRSDVGIEVEWQGYLGDHSELEAIWRARMDDDGRVRFVPHGLTRYRQQGCRCEVCVAADDKRRKRHREQSRRRRAALGPEKASAYNREYYRRRCEQDPEYRRRLAENQRRRYRQQREAQQ